MNKHIQIYNSSVAHRRRRFLGLTTHQLASKIGASPASIKFWECGYTTPKSIAHRIGLARELRTRWNSLFPSQDREGAIAGDKARKAKKELGLNQRHHRDRKAQPPAEQFEAFRNVFLH